MTPNKSWFIAYKKLEGGNIYMGNDQACKIIGIRDVSLKLISGIERILTDVRHIHTLNINLISLGILAKYGFEFKGYGNELRVIK